MPPRIAFDGLFRPSPLKNVAPGAWYLGFRCAACGKPVAVLDDPTASGEVETGGRADFEVLCPHCGQTRTYPASALSAWRASTGSPSGLD